MCEGHALVFPHPYQGHITPTLNLAAKLVSHGFTVTFVLPHFIQSQTSAGGIRCVSISDGFPVEFDRDLNMNEYWESMILHFPARVGELVESIKKSDEPTQYFLVADTLCTWAADIATKHGLVNVSLWTGTALCFSLGYHLDLQQPNAHFPYKGSSVEHIPGIESISTNDVMTEDAVPIMVKIMKLAFEQVKKADFILCNTVEELEPHCLSAVNRSQPIYAVGPIISFSSEISLRRQSDCSAWLESKPAASVLYISLGSIFEFNSHEITEMAHALLSSQANFIWVLKAQNKDSDYAGVLPEGFLDDVGERGLVVPWCDQMGVLSSPAVGGFLTHCGWNSILESVSCGVPMAVWPMFAEQQSNAFLLVKELEIAVEIKMDYRRSSPVIVDAGTIEKGIMKLMDPENKIRANAKELMEKSRNVLTKGGSSYNYVHRFIEDAMGKLNH